MSSFATEQDFKIVEQKTKLPIDNANFEKSFTTGSSSSSVLSERKVHGSLFPDYIRGLVVGKSGCGKTNLIITLLLHKNGLKFSNVYLVSKSLYQTKYETLKKVFKLLPQIGLYCFSNSEELPSPDKCKLHSVVIFDDVSSTNELNTKMREYFSMARHRLISVFLLCQSYARISKALIRDNANFIILFRQDALNLKHVYDDHLSADDIKFEKFLNVCKYAWNKSKHGFVVLDLEKNLYKGRLRCSFHHFIVLKT